jgi:hypothetical protein
MPCFVILDFKNGTSFESAGFKVPMAEDTIERVHLNKQFPKDSVATKALNVVTSIIAGLAIVLALALPFLAAGVG